MQAYMPCTARLLATLAVACVGVAARSILSCFVILQFKGVTSTLLYSYMNICRFASTSSGLSWRDCKKNPIMFPPSFNPRVSLATLL